MKAKSKTKQELLIEVKELRRRLDRVEQMRSKEIPNKAELTRLASFPQLNPNPVVEVDLAGRVHYSNPAADQLFPDLRKAGLDHPWFVDLQKASETAEITSKRPYVRELRLGDRWYVQSIHSVLEGTRLRIYAFEVTGRKQTEEALRDSEQQLRQAIELLEAVTMGTNVIIAAQDLHLRYTFFNAAYAAEMKQLTGKDIRIGSSMADLLGDQPEQLAVAEREWREALAGKTTNKRLEFGDPHFHRRVYNIFHTPIHDTNGLVVGAGEVAYDITDYTQAEQDLRESEARIAGILNSISDGFMTLGNDLVVTYFNRAAEKLLGRRQKDILGRNLFDAFPQAKGSIFEEKYSWALKQKKPTAFETYFGLEPYENWYDVRVYPHDYGISVYFRVITEEKKAAEAVRKNKERFELLAETASKLLATQNPQGIVNELCLKVMTHLDCHAFFNYLVDPTGQRLHLNAYAGIPEQTGKEIEWLDYGVAVCGCAARDASRIVCENIPVTPDPRTELVKSFGIKAYACHPLHSAERVIGTLSFGTRSRTTFTEEDLSLMKTVADQVANAMERMRLIEDLGRARDELEIRVMERTAELARANELLEKVFSSVDVCLAYMDRDFNFIRVNRAYAETDEREPDFYVGKNHFALFPNAENETIFKTVVNTGEPYAAYAKPFEYAEHPERGVTYWDWNLQPVKEPDGSLGGVVLSLMNITERVRAQEAVSAERQRFFDVLETLPAYVVLLTPDYHAPFANRTFRERFGESHGLRCFEFLFGRSEPCETCETYSVLKTMAPHEWEWTGPDGRIYSVYDFPFIDVDGSTLILEMGIDITEQRQAEEELKKKEEQIRFFASEYLNAQETERRRIAVELHDSIASALAGIKFRIEKTAEDMKKGLGSTESIKDLSSHLSRAIGEVRRIMADLRPSILDDLGLLPALNWFCREYEKTYSQITIEKQIDLSEEEIPESLKIVIFRITQEAMNNIAKHSGASLVGLALGRAGEMVELAIRDNGHGFRHDEIEKGLGLSTMRERAELSGGAFAVQSAKGKGTIIRASWPLAL